MDGRHAGYGPIPYENRKKTEMNPKRPQIVWTGKMVEIVRWYYPTMFNRALAAWLGARA
jgi:hypothetical protein